ncbi:L-rhamnose isomerase [Hydrogenispora ethanolica]|uniref:L-rhamnose isomerase n=1 Tax=Hydrogenispora ethanolica TaxID=1082276 RepID=A0A4R1SB50_HYDET|nr:L-rhamnose isomerase [Hydrogenispora ethanolica]TCL76766.1 L-rhamnose isomerase [Hydrogenispora ethanolica]
MNHTILEAKVRDGYQTAREIYAAYGVDTDQVLDQLAGVQISLHCWQGDDVGGFEAGAGELSGGGILATGNYPGKARNGEELRQDLGTALGLIPGKHRVNLHASYAETGGDFVERDQLTIDLFQNWLAWAEGQGIGLDFNPTFFSHPKAAAGFTLSSRDPAIRSFWIRHAQCCREIAARMGARLGSPCVNNIWVPDGSKDLPADRLVHRQLLKESLDEILAVSYDRAQLVDAVESKLFGIGSESYVVGSHEFYMGYGLSRQIAICLDMGHFHPTESIADKLSALLLFAPHLLLHVSRGVRWDSDHVVILNDDLIALAHEIKRCDAWNRISLALDFFDASINRISAWVIGARATLKALLYAMLEPTDRLAAEEARGNLGNRLALLEELKTLPFGAVWHQYCLTQNVPVGTAWLDHVAAYERDVLAKRGR